MSIWLELSRNSRKNGRIYSGNQIVVHTGSEDVLTANVFGIIKNLDHEVWLRSFLSDTLDTEINSEEFENVEFHFWKRYPPPREYRKKEGSSEVDVTLESGSTVVFVEAKYRSSISSHTTHDEERDQIIRNLDVGLNYSQKMKKRFFLLLVTNENEPPELLSHYRNNPREIERKLPHQKGFDLISCLAWVSWSEIMNTLKEKLEEFSPSERRFVNDLLRYLQIKLQVESSVTFSEVKAKATT